MDVSPALDRNTGRAPGPGACADPGTRGPADARSLGRNAQALKNRHFLAGIWRALAAVAVVIVIAAVLAFALGGPGFPGLFLTALTALLSAALLLRYPRLGVPARADLARGPLATVIGRTELWLESRCGQMPPAAAAALRQIALELDWLGLELAQVGDVPAAGAEIRQTVGQRLPDLVAGWNPASGDDEATLVSGLMRIADELGFITRHLALGTLDDLMIRAYRLDRRGPAAAR